MASYGYNNNPNADVFRLNGKATTSRESDRRYFRGNSTTTSVSNPVKPTPKFIRHAAPLVVSGGKRLRNGKTVIIFN